MYDKIKKKKKEKKIIQLKKKKKASGGDGIPAERFQIPKDDAVKVLHSVCQQIWKTRQWPQDWKRSVFIPVPKKGNATDQSACAFKILMDVATFLSRDLTVIWDAD